ncbi:MAG: hypothetical protein JW741_06930 [Sedimentisphaerales bacterium]|nr:hypothetical protein [Sedimentisphaerales bacterium]
MSGEIGNNKRLLSITGGNLRNRHLYISGYYDFFPAECYGQSSARKGTGRKLTLVVDGLTEPVETDIAIGSGSGRPRSFFRKRAWVGDFSGAFTREATWHESQGGDYPQQESD